MLLLLALAACSSPSDDGKATDDTGPVDTDADTDTEDSDTNAPNEAPSAAEIAILPAVPSEGVDITVVIVTPSTDPDGDPVTYGYAWTVDGAPTGLDGATVPGASVGAAQTWQVTVTPTDGIDAGPATTASVIVGNTAPSAPGLSFDPAEPLEGDDITLVFDPPAIDADGDPITTTITWYDDGSLDARLDGVTVVDGRYVANNETFRAVVTVTDGYHAPVVTEASVTVTYRCDAPPPYNLGDKTLPEARAYHGLAFDEADGTLIGYDGRGALVKTDYGGDRTVFLPGIGTIQQMDRLPDGDWVMGDSDNNRLLRVTPAGGYETLASGVGYVYGVTVGPDGMVYVSNGGVLRVDPATGASTTLVDSGSGWTAHVVNFNLDSTVMYIGTIGRGDLYYMDLDADLEPITEPLLFASDVGRGWHDGIELDNCGNLYVADYSSSGLYRVTPEGTVTSFVATDSAAYGHGTVWGNGVGGWRSDAIYQPQPYNGNTVREVVIGFSSGDTVRTWKGEPVPW